MATTRAANPSGAKLLDESKAHPGSLDKSIFQQRQSSSSGAGQGTVNDNYLTECREDNPEPASQATDATSQVQLSNCRILTPVDSLKLNEDFEMAVDLKKLDPAAASTANFSLFATRTRDGKEERAKIWADKPGKADDDKADPIVVKAKDVLATQDDYQLGEKVVFELEASHEGAEAPCKSGPVEVGLKCLAKWVGGDNLFFRNDGEFPLLKDDASLVEVLATAVEYVQQMKPGAEESAVCFGYASSVGAANSNRKLSLRRAQAIKAILDRDFETWEALAKVNFTTIDIQQFLSDLHMACGWECDPGAVDGQSDPQTKAAILAFQKECNSRYRYGLKEDGVCGPKTWRGVLRTIHGLVQAEIGGDPATEPNWNKPKWGHSGKGVYANGEDAATGGDKPEERSVQITFFAPGSEPALVDAPDGDPTNPELNPILNAERYEKEKLERQRRNAERARQAEEERKRGAETNGGGPTPPTEPDLFAEFRRLETLADSDNYELDRKITAFRKIYYDKGYTNTLIWDQLIAGAKDVTYPPTWGDMVAEQRDMGGRKVMTLNGQPVDISHVFAGADARNHLAAVELLLCHLRSNVEASTWVGDLGSVVVEYIHNTNAKNFAGERTADLENFFDRDPRRAKFDLGDQISDIDGVLIDFAAAGSVVGGLEAYYAENGPWRQRWSRFLPIFERAKSGLRDAVFNAAVAYAMAHYRADLNQLFASVQPPSSNDPYSPIDFSNISIHLDLPIIGRIDIYTLREQYWNNCQWVIDIFEERIHANRHG